MAIAFAFGSTPALHLPPFHAALPEPVREATPFLSNLGVKRGDDKQEQQEIGDRLPQALDKERAARDSGESSQSDDFSIRRERQADRQSRDARMPQRLAKRKMSQQDDDPHEEHARNRDAVERQEGMARGEDRQQDGGDHSRRRQQQGQVGDAVAAEASKRLRQITIAR
jgi:hypothetical protein